MTPPKTEQEQVEAVILDIAVERRRIGTKAMLAEVVLHPWDERECQTARNAIASLREYGLLMPEQVDGMVVPTPAAVKADALRI